MKDLKKVNYKTYSGFIASKTVKKHVFSINSSIFWQNPGLSFDLLLFLFFSEFTLADHIKK
jgi:hypothetical protein